MKPREVFFKTLQEFLGYLWYGANHLFIFPYMLIRLSQGLDYLVLESLGISSHEQVFSFIPLTILNLISFVVIAFGVLIILESAISIVAQSKGFAFSVTPHYHVNPKKLATTGWYARVRHPMVLGYLIVLMGIGVYIQSPSMVIWFVPLLGAIYVEYLLMIEEPQLLRWFGTSYEKYQHEVPLLIPRLKRR